LGKHGLAKSEDEGAVLFITTAGDLFSGAEGRTGDSVEAPTDNFGPGTGQGLFYAENS